MLYFICVYEYKYIYIFFDNIGKKYKLCYMKILIKNILMPIIKIKKFINVYKIKLSFISNLILKNLTVE